VLEEPDELDELDRPPDEPDGDEPPLEDDDALDNPLEDAELLLDEEAPLDEEELLLEDDAPPEEELSLLTSLPPPLPPHAVSASAAVETKPSSHVLCEERRIVAVPCRSFDNFLPSDPRNPVAATGAITGEMLFGDREPGQ